MKAHAEAAVEALALDHFQAFANQISTGTALDDRQERASPTSTILVARAKAAIQQLNPHLPDEIVTAVVNSLSRPPHPTLVENNRWLYQLLTAGAPVEYKDSRTGELRGGLARLLDHDQPENNELLVVQQLSIQSANGKTIRPDLILFVNGLPLVIIELKDPANATADLNSAIDQLERYKTAVPELFIPNLLLVVSDGLLTRVGSITSGKQRFTPWRPAAGGEPTLEALIKELLHPTALLDYLVSCVAFEEDARGNIVKKIAGYHQFRAVRNARKQIIAAVLADNQRQDAAATGIKSGTGFQPVLAVVQRQDATGIQIRQGAYLPHWTREGAVYAVTFRLGDSLPQSVLLAWKKERDAIVNRSIEMNRQLTQEEERRIDQLYSEKIESHLDVGNGKCWMQQPEIAELVERSLKHFDGVRYRLLAWCVMPNHVHVVVKPNPGNSLSEITHSWKSFTGTEANRQLARKGVFWQKESYDHIIRDVDDLEHAICYVLDNPRKAGLTDWRWVGSAPDIMAIVTESGTGFQPVLADNQRQDAAATVNSTGVNSGTGFQPVLAVNQRQDAAATVNSTGVNSGTGFQPVLTKRQQNNAAMTGKCGGVIWHTQGSGKSLTMLMLAGTLVRAAEMANPTVLIVTDRNDLDDQLFDTFAMGRGLLRQDPIQANSRDHLRDLLDRASGGVIFTTMHKFTESHGKISERANIVVMADEAHRSQYGFVEGGARWMRDALPNATFVGFTGTPLVHTDTTTRQVFGDYADKYDIRQAVEDGATVPIYYEPRIVKLTIDRKGLEEAERQIAKVAEVDENGESTEDVRIPVEALVGAPERLVRVAKFIVEHWEQRRTAMEGKAMIVTMSRDIAARLYEEIIKIRPAWHDAAADKGVLKVIMTSGSNDTGPLLQHQYTKSQRAALADRFKDPADAFRLAIVVDMWLTGFDVPCAHTMYLDKPLGGHNLMQAIARVNRVYGDKPGGLIVDLIGIADPLADALNTYANATGATDKPIKELQDEAIPAMMTAYEQLQNFFHGFNYLEALEKDFRQILQVYRWAVDHVFSPDQTIGEETGWKRFRGMVKRLSRAYALAVPRQETVEITPHLAFFQRVEVMARKFLAEERGPTDSSHGTSDVDLAVRQVLGGTVEAGDVIDLFAASGFPQKSRLDILSDEFLERVRALEQKNLALETLRKLLNDQIKISERTNLVQSQKFREALEKAMLGYTNKQITTAEMISQLLELAKWVREVKNHGQDLGLNADEVAFYDALAENGSAKEIMKSDQLRLMARELAEIVKKMPKLDWTKRENVRADLRRKVRRLLAMYGYPPDLSEDATQLVLKQAELSTENGVEE
ncbi:MAG: HsdR family type I site-specific deoxyribonuclease [Zavarzinella sp.]